MKTNEMAEQAEQERRRLALLCVDGVFAQAQIPCAIVDRVRGIAERYGVEVAVEVCAVVLRAYRVGQGHWA